MLTTSEANDVDYEQLPKAGNVNCAPNRFTYEERLRCLNMFPTYDAGCLFILDLATGFNLKGHCVEEVINISAYDCCLIKDCKR